MARCSMVPKFGQRPTPYPLTPTPSASSLPPPPAFGALTLPPPPSVARKGRMIRKPSPCGAGGRPVSEANRDGGRRQMNARKPISRTSSPRDSSFAEPMAMPSADIFPRRWRWSRPAMAPAIPVSDFYADAEVNQFVLVVDHRYTCRKGCKLLEQHRTEDGSLQYFAFSCLISVTSPAMLIEDYSLH